MQGFLCENNVSNILTMHTIIYLFVSCLTGTISQFAVKFPAAGQLQAHLKLSYLKLES